MSKSSAALNIILVRVLTLPKVGGNQAVLGPFLAVPYARPPNPEKPNTVVYGHTVALAETGSASTDVAVEVRKCGL